MIGVTRLNNLYHGAPRRRPAPKPPSEASALTQPAHANLNIPCCYTSRSCETATCAVASLEKCWAQRRKLCGRKCSHRVVNTPWEAPRRCTWPQRPGSWQCHMAARPHTVIVNRAVPLLPESCPDPRPRPPPPEGGLVRLRPRPGEVGGTTGGSTGGGSTGGSTVGGGVTRGALLQGVPRSVAPVVNAPHTGTPQNPEAGQGDPCTRKHAVAGCAGLIVHIRTKISTVDRSACM